MGRGDREAESDPAEGKGRTMMRTKTQQTKPRYRLATSVFQHDPDDWPGIFIRGDDALGYAHAIRAVLRQTGKAIEKAIEAAREQGASTSEFESLIELAELLESCRVESKKGR
jgi:hypothetical protein